MFIVIPIRTESVIRRTPVVNYALIAANVASFMLLNDALAIESLARLKSQHLAFHPGEPSLHQFFTYQFLHAGPMHLLGNMLFLWVFGNSVNAKMGGVPYLLFYLAGGVFAAWVFALVTAQPAQLVGASGAIAGVTTAYLALFPRSHVTVLVWIFLFIHFFEVPAMLLIGLKVIVWDNIIAPGLGGADAIAYSAHLAGYLFGFVGAVVMLLVRGLPRDQFDLVAVWKRWHQRRTFAAAMADPAAAARAQYGSVGRVPAGDPRALSEQHRRFDEITDLRSRISDAVDRRDPAQAAGLYEHLLALDEGQCLSERNQLEVARWYYNAGRFQEAARAFERFVACYPGSGDAGDVRLLLGIIFARDLHDLEGAERHLAGCLRSLSDDARRRQCETWLSNVRAALGRSAPLHDGPGP